MLDDERNPREAGAHPPVILLAEDEAAVREFVRVVLERAGYDVLEAASGDQALELAADPAEPIDLLLTDVIMPRMKGPALAEALRRNRPGLRVLFMSGFTDESLPSGKGAKAFPLLSKPFRGKALLEKVHEVLAADPPEST